MSKSPGTILRHVQEQKFQLELEEPDPRRAKRSALTSALAYIVGGLILLGPYFILPTIRDAFWTSVATTLVALAVFGYVKGRFTVKTPLRSDWQTMGIGALAAGAAYGLPSLFG